MIEIRETSKDDLKNIQRLWADKEVMAHVGIPDGIDMSDEEMDKYFESVVSNRANLNHYSIYNNNKYCGEVHYRISAKHSNMAELGIKLYEFARGSGIAEEALSYMIEEAYKKGADVIYVNPSPKNKRAIAFYKKVGFTHKDAPDSIVEGLSQFDDYYMELSDSNLNNK